MCEADLAASLRWGCRRSQAEAQLRAFLLHQPPEQATQCNRLVPDGRQRRLQHKVHSHLLIWRTHFFHAPVRVKCQFKE